MTTQEKRQPLPAGRYWITVKQDQVNTFASWAQSNKSKVRIEVTEGNEEEPVVFFIFNIKKPLKFDQQSFGFPNVAPASIKSKADTSQRPDPEPDALPPIFSGLFGAVSPLVIIGIVLLVMSNSKGSR